MAADPPIMLMDEPFGAIDPIARERLQNDFLGLHRQVRKTVIFVTHDIDEAIKMGDKIAIMREGRLVQLATPDALLASPADEFVASFVGEDRALKRLRVRTLRDIELEPPSANEQPAPQALDTTSLQYALSRMLTEGVSRVDVIDEGQRRVGSARLQTIMDSIAPATAPEPTDRDPAAA
jgi:osmoprotectant transport system ATP-binding protein